MKKRYFGLIKSLALALGLIFSIESFSQVLDLAEADVPVPDRSEATLQRSMKLALGAALVKLSGNKDILSVPAVQDAIQKDPASFVQSYSYQNRPASPGSNQGPPIFLHIQFSQSLLQKVLVDAKQTVWPADSRPVALAVVSVRPENQQPAYILSGDMSDDPLEQLMLAASNRRGLPLLFPMMDIADQNALGNPGDTAVSADTLKALANRYGVTTIFYGDINKNEEGAFQARWRLIADGEEATWQNAAASLDDVLQSGVDFAADTLANKQGVLADTALQSTVTIQVQGIENLEDYAAAMQYLRHLVPVSKVIVQDVAPDSVVYEVTASGGEESLVQAIQVSKKMQTMMQLPSSQWVALNAQLHYRWHANRRQTS